MAQDTGSPSTDPSPRLRYRLNPAAGLTERQVGRSGRPEAFFRNQTNGQVFRLGPEECFLLREITAGTPYAHITAAFRAEFGKTVRPRAIAAFAAQMMEMGALTIDDGPAAGTGSGETAPSERIGRPTGLHEDGAYATAQAAHRSARVEAAPPEREPAPRTSSGGTGRTESSRFARRRNLDRESGLDETLEDLVFSAEDTDRGGPGAGPHAGAGSPEPSPSSPADPEIAERRVRFAKSYREGAGPGMIRLFDPSWLLRLLNWLFGWTAILAAAVLVPLTTIATLVLFHRLPEVSFQLQDGRNQLSLIGVLILSAFSVNLFRTLCVGVAAHRWGATPKHLGLVFVLFIVPRFTIDQSVIRQLPREGQLAVYAAAMKSRLFLFGVGTTVWAATRHDTTMLPELALLVGQIGLFSFLFAALPVMPQDGYRYLTTYFDLPMLRERAFHHVFGYPRRGPGGMRFPPAGSGEGWVFYFYVVGAVLFIGLLLTLFAFYVSTALEERFGGTGVLMFFGLTGLILFWLATMRRFRNDRTNDAIRSAMASRRSGGGDTGRGGMGPEGMGLGSLRGDSGPALGGGGRIQTLAEPGLPWVPGQAVGHPRPPGPSAPLPGQYGGNEKRARRARWRTRIVLAVAAAGLLYVAFLPYNFEVGGEFTILPASRVQVNAGVEGELVEILVDEGDVVVEGQVMARLSDLQPRYQLEVRRAELAQAEAALQKLLEGSTPEEIAVARAEVARAEALLPYYDSQAERAQTLLESGVMSDADAQQQITRYVEEQQALETARAKLAVVEASATASEIAMAEAQVAALAAQVAYDEALLERVELRAPAGGRVVTENLSLQLGKALNAGDLFAEVENHEITPAEVRVPETDIGLVEIGDRVRLRAWALADVEWTGEVRAVSPVAEDENFGRIVRVRTDIPNTGGFFRPQMTGYAKISGGEMRTWEAFTRLFDRFFRIEVWGWIP